MNTTEQNVSDWITENYAGSLTAWIKEYLDDDFIDDPDLKDLDRWDISGISAHIVNALEDISRGDGSGSDFLEEFDSIESALSLNDGQGESFYEELIEFFYNSAEKDFVVSGGASSLADGAL
jgi:hypothetical protein